MGYSYTGRGSAVRPDQMIIVRLGVGQEVEVCMSHNAENIASRTFRVPLMEDKEQVAVPLTESGCAYERGTENLRMFLRDACSMREIPDMHMQVIVPVQRPRVVKKIIDLSL